MAAVHVHGRHNGVTLAHALDVAALVVIAVIRFNGRDNDGVARGRVRGAAVRCGVSGRGDDGDYDRVWILAFGPVARALVIGLLRGGGGVTGIG